MEQLTLQDLKERNSFSYKGIDFEFQPEPALEAARKAYEIFTDSSSFFHNFDLPQEILPKSIEVGSEEYGLYKLHLVMLDTLSESVPLYKKIARFTDMYYKNHNKFFFTPQNITSLVLGNTISTNPRIILKHITNDNGKCGIGPDKKFDFLFSNSQVLEEKFNSSVSDLDELCGFDVVKNRKLLRENFNGIGVNASLLQRYLFDSGVWKFNNPEMMVPKVDIQKSRLPFSLGFYEVNDQTQRDFLRRNGVWKDSLVKQFETMYRDLTWVLSDELGESSYEILKGLDEVLWRTGSSLCSESSLKVCESQCLYYNDCKGLSYITSAQKKSRNKPVNPDQGTLFDKLEAVSENDKNKRIKDRITGEQIPTVPGRIYPFIDVRTNNGNSKTPYSAKSHNGQGSLF